MHLLVTFLVSPRWNGLCCHSDGKWGPGSSDSLPLAHLCDQTPAVDLQLCPRPWAFLRGPVARASSCGLHLLLLLAVSSQHLKLSRIQHLLVSFQVH